MRYFHCSSGAAAFVNSGAIMIVIAVLVAGMTGCAKKTDDLASMDSQLSGISKEVGPEEAVKWAKSEAEAKNTAEAWERLAQAYTLVNNKNEVLKALKKALEIDPDYPRAVAGMAIIKLRTGKVDEAMTLASKLLDASGKGPAAAQITNARALLVKREYAKAHDQMATAIAQHPKDPTVVFGFADTAVAVDKTDEAITAYRKAVKLRPEEPQYHRGLMQILVRTKSMDQAVAAAQDAQCTLPDSDVIQFVAGSVYSAAGKTDEATNAYEEALVINPEMWPAANNLAITLADDDAQLVRAEKLASDALRADKQNHAYADTLGWIWVKAGKYDQAIKLLRDIHSRWPGSPAVKFHLGYALVKSGHREEGQKFIKEAAESDVNDPAVIQARQELKKTF